MHKKSSSNSKINSEFLEALGGLRIHFFGVSNFHAWCVHAEFILLRIISDSFICIKVMNVSNKSVEGFLFPNRWFTERSTEVNCTHIEQLSRRDQFQRRNIQDWHWGGGGWPLDSDHKSFRLVCKGKRYSFPGRPRTGPGNCPTLKLGKNREYNVTA